VFVYTLQPVVLPVVQPVGRPLVQPVVSCKQASSGLYNLLDVCLHDAAGCQPVAHPVGRTTGWTAGWTYTAGWTAGLTSGWTTGYIAQTGYKAAPGGADIGIRVRRR